MTRPSTLAICSALGALAIFATCSAETTVEPEVDAPAATATSATADATWIVYTLPG